MVSSVNIHACQSFEEQLADFRERAGLSLPTMTCGAGLFLRELGQWQERYCDNASDSIIAKILPSPSQGLSFPNATDVLSFALSMSSSLLVDESDVLSLLDSFGLPEDKASQPISTLSGGELLLLTYAKAKAMSPVVEGLVACSPTHWLSQERYEYWRRLVGEYSVKDKRIDVILLDGEPFPDEERDECDDQMERIPPIKWGLHVDNLYVSFEEIRFPSYHPSSVISYCTDCNGLFALDSPTLLSGDNGVGKSILAKVLCGIVKCDSGIIRLETPNGKEWGRVVFQKTLEQLFGKSIDDHLDWVFKFDKTRRRDALSLYERMDSIMREHVKSRDLQELGAIGAQTTHSTILQLKISLVAERLASKPSVLILDEPAWGLSRSIARKFVWAVCHEASRCNVAVLMISHHSDYWTGLVRSHLHLTNNKNGNVKIEQFALEELS